MFDLGYYPILSHLDQGWRSYSLGFESTMPSSRTQTNPKKGVQHLFIEDMCENPPRLFVWFSFHFTAIEQVSFPQPRRSEIVPSPIVLRAEQEIRYSSTDIGNFMCVFPQTILSVSLLWRPWIQWSLVIFGGHTAEKQPICCAAFGQKNERSVMVSYQAGWVEWSQMVENLFVILRYVLHLGGGFKYIMFMFTHTWGNDPVWLIFFRWVETTNKPSLCSCMIDSLCPVVYLFRKRT